MLCDADSPVDFVTYVYDPPVGNALFPSVYVLYVVPLVAEIMFESFGDTLNSGTAALVGISADPNPW